MLIAHRVAAIIAIACVVSGLAAQQPVLVADINKSGGLVSGEQVDEAVAFGPWVYYAAEGGAGVGVELYRTTGAPGSAELFVDINPGSSDSDPDSFTVMGNELFFVAASQATGRELWKTDGTVAGTSMVIDLSNPRWGLGDHDLVVMGGELYFAAGQWGGLWRTDGTAAGTTQVHPVSATNITAIGNVLFFSGTDVTPVGELWISDGTTAGTFLVKDLNGVGPSYPKSFVALNGECVFTAFSDPGCCALWKSDGTAAGTVKIIDLGLFARDPLVVAGSHVYFANADARGTELWKSDGTPGGTDLVVDPTPNGSTDPDFITALGDRVLFKEAFPSSLAWVSDGTAAGSQPLAPTTRGFFVAGGTAWFGANSSGSWNLWNTDGTLRGTQVVGNFNTPFPEFLTLDSAGQLLMFGSQGGVGIYAVDLSQLTAYSLPHPIATGNSGSRPELFIDAFGVTFFRADDSVAGSELWKTDGTPAGTQLVADIQPGSGGSHPSEFTLLHDTLYFTAADSTNGRELWKTDGTTAGTQLVIDLAPGVTPSSPYALTVAEDRLFFGAWGGLWVTDGTAQGTTGVTSLGVSWMVGYGDQVVFATANHDLWVSDGTPGGTLLLGRALASGVGPYVLFDGEIYFCGQGLTGWELYKTDGTVAGTTIAVDVLPGLNSSFPGQLTVVGDDLYFVGTSPATGKELWKTDGTQSGTTMVADISPGATGSNIRDLVALPTAVLFNADAGGGEDLWVSDGTAGGTRVLATGTANSLTAVGSRRAYFGRLDPVDGDELWETDGTLGGTRAVFDLSLGFTGSAPRDMTLSGGRLLFSADNGILGREVWSFDPGATSQPVGHGCSGSARQPTLTASDPVLGGVMTVRGAEVAGGQAGVVLLGLPSPAVVVSTGCEVYFQAAGAAVLVPFATSGERWSVGIPIPNAIAITGISVALQAVLGPSTSALGADLTNGAVITFGR